MTTDVLVCFVLCLLCVNVQISTQNVIHKGEVVIVAQDINPGAPDILSDDTVLARGKSLVRESKNEGLIPLFKMARGWMDDIVVPDRLYKLIARENVETWEDYDDIGFGAWSNYFAGIYAFCAIGLLFIIVFPILSCIYCCCAGCLGAICCCFKICTCCCKPSEPSTCRIAFWSLLAFGLIGTMFATIICAYISTEMINKELKGGSKGGLYDDMTNGLTDAEKFFIDAANETNVVVNNRAVTGKEDVNNLYEDFPNQCLSAIDNATSAKTYLDQLIDFTNVIETPLKADLEVMVATDYTNNENALTGELDRVESALELLLDQCIGDENAAVSAKCTEAKTNLVNLKTDASYSALSGATTDAVTALEAALTAEIVTKVADLLQVYQNIANDISSDIDPNQNDVATEMDVLIANLTSATSIYNNMILHNYTSLFSDLIQQVNDSQTDGEFKNYWSWLVVFPSHLFTTALLVIVSAYLIGITLDLICSTKLALGSKVVSLCNLATLLLLFLVMIPCSGFFGYGTYLHGRYCRHLVAVDDSFEVQSKLYLNGRNINYNFSATEIMEGCSQNKGLYSAFQIENTGFKISDYADINKISEIANKVTAVDINIGSVILMPPDVESILNDVDAKLTTVNIDGADGYNIQNAKPVTIYSVPQYIQDLEDIVEDMTDAGNKGNIQAQIDILKTANVDFVQPMESEKAKITSSTASAESIIEGTNIPDLIQNIKTAGTAVNTDANDIAKGKLPKLAEDISDRLTTFSTDLDTTFGDDIAQCRSLYDSVNTAIYAPCVYLLYPFNAIWFVYGWYIAFGIAAFFVTKRYQAVMEQKRDSR